MNVWRGWILYGGERIYVEAAITTRIGDLVRLDLGVWVREV